MSTLSEKRCRFTFLLGLLIIEANNRNLEIAIDQSKRTKTEALKNAEDGVGIVNSLHVLGLAADFLLYRKGEYVTDSAQYAGLGMFWESLDPLARWGGRFKDKNGDPAPDGGHFSLEHNGVK